MPLLEKVFDGTGETGENLVVLEYLSALEGQLLLLAAVFGVLTFGVVIALIFAGDRHRAQGLEISTRRKLGHEYPARTRSFRDLWERIGG